MSLARSGAGPRILSHEERLLAERLIRDDPASWMETHFYLEDPRNPITGELYAPGPIQLAPHQKAIVREALSKGPDGLFNYSTIVYSTIKKSGKTRLAAGVACWFAATQGTYQEIYCMANDGKQSTDRILSAVKKAVSLNPYLRSGPHSWKRTATRIVLPNQTFIEAIPCDPKGSAGANPSLTIWSEMWGYTRALHKERLWCFDEQTQLLTKYHGWQGPDWFKDHPHEPIATMNPGTHKFEWQVPRGWCIKPYDGPMWKIKSKRADMLVTPNHRLYGKLHMQDSLSKETAPVRFWTPEEIMPYFARNKRHRFSPVPSTRGWVAPVAEGEGIEIPGSATKPPMRFSLGHFVSFTAWYLAEGSKQSKGGIQIAQSVHANPDKHNEVHELCLAMGLRPKQRIDGMSISIHDVRLVNYFQRFGRSWEKYIPDWIKDLPVEQLASFLDVYIRADGTVNSTGWDIATVSERMATDLVEIAQKCGLRTSWAAYSHKNSSRTQYKIRLRPGGENWTNIGPEHFDAIEYKGTVYCPSTANGIVLYKRGTCILWSGNTEMTIPPTRWGRSLRWVESYAGFSDDPGVLFELYETAVLRGRRHPGFPHLPVYISDEANMLCYWDSGDAARRMPWQTEEYYAAQAATLRPEEFDRVHRNQWATSVQKAIDIAKWDACLDSTLQPLGPREPCVMALDASVSGDCSAAVLVTQHPDPARRARDIAVRKVQVWEPARGQQLDLNDTIEATLYEWTKKYNVVEVAYDRYQLHSIMTRARRSGIKVYDFGQTVERNLSDKQFYDMVIAGQMAHDGDSTLRAHVDNAAVKLIGERFRFVKQDMSTNAAKSRYRKPIDALVATSMGVFRCKHLNLDL